MKFIEKALEYVSQHPHFLREFDGTLSTQRLVDRFTVAWTNGWVNIVLNNKTNNIQDAFVGIFMAYVADQNTKDEIAVKYPEILKIDGNVLMIPMVHISKEKGVPFTDIYRIMYKAAQLAYAKAIYVIDGRKRIIYNFNKRNYKYNGNAKYLIFNKNIWFEV